jgi:hypothetical protein
MNRLTAIGLASLVAYGLLIASKYTGMVSAAREENASQALASGFVQERTAEVAPVKPAPATPTISLPPPIARSDSGRLSAVALEFRSARDLKSFSDTLLSRRAHLTGDERYHLARALEECLFATTINEDLASYSAKQKRQFLAGLPTDDPLNSRRIAAYDAADSTQRCVGFQNSKISRKEIDELLRAAAMQGDGRAQARVVTAELTKASDQNRRNNADKPEAAQNTNTVSNDELAHLIGLLESPEPEAMLIVGEYLSRQSQNLRVGPNGEVPEPSAFLAGFSLVACDRGLDCSQMHREVLNACSYGGYCNAQNFEELYQNFLASPWAATQAMRYRGLIHTAIRDRNWSLIGLVPKALKRPVENQ